MISDHLKDKTDPNGAEAFEIAQDYYSNILAKESDEYDERRNFELAKARVASSPIHKKIEEHKIGLNSTN